jgi:hypothetical protein
VRPVPSRPTGTTTPHAPHSQPRHSCRCRQSYVSIRQYTEGAIAGGLGGGRRARRAAAGFPVTGGDGRKRVDMTCKGARSNSARLGTQHDKGQYTVVWMAGHTCCRLPRGCHDGRTARAESPIMTHSALASPATQRATCNVETACFAGREVLITAAHRSSQSVQLEDVVRTARLHRRRVRA